ncbi:MAG: hypothetical protein RLO50_02010 [Azospirillaceae bacterium]
MSLRMPVKHIIGLALVLTLSALAWVAYENLGQLRGTLFWEFRYILLAAVGFVVLSLMQWVWDKLTHLRE